VNIDVKRAYDTWHAAQRAETAADAPWHQLLKPLLTDLAGKRVLEIACGRGGFSVWIAQLPRGHRPAEIVASDFSSVALRLAEELGRSRGVENVAYRLADVMSLAWKDASFDVAISCETIEHLPYPKRAVMELARVLRPGGALYLTCPNYLNLMGLYRCYLPLTGRTFSEGGQPIAKFLVLPLVRRWVRQAGLVIELTQGAGHYVPCPRRSPIRMYWMDRLGPMSRWIALHTVIVARKPQPGARGAAR
jgi:ubiquinone/menaquinone biosynthesis C-methylase UbiE